jgi:hypothetical protein
MLFAERLEETRAHLAKVNDPMLEELRTRLLRNLDLQEAKARGTNLPAPAATNATTAK